MDNSFAGIAPLCFVHIMWCLYRYRILALVYGLGSATLMRAYPSLEQMCSCPNDFWLAGFIPF